MTKSITRVVLIDFTNSRKPSSIDTFDYQNKRSQVLIEINSNKVSIDRDTFIQDKRKDLKEAKRVYLLNKGTETHNKERYSIANYILKNPLICGSLVVICKN